MTSDTNIAALERMAEMINTGNLDSFGEVVDQDAVDHDPAPGQQRGIEGFRGFFTTLRAGFPDLQLTPVTIVANDEHVAMAYTINGTHQGEFQGIAPTGKQISARGVEIVKFRDGKMVERWGSSDEMGILGQLGMTMQPS
ncbi:MAG: ester cyclase [Actinobacteria bacterium]|nr:ester cyclase [Actinomycetota bacterium]